MRAHWIKDLTVHEDYIIKGDALHHLAHVVRIKIGEELLLLNGKGQLVHTIVNMISKKELYLKMFSNFTQERKFQFDLALGIPKKEALELCLKEATELGVRNIYLIRSDFSQTGLPEPERIERILVSALEQSNAAFIPTVIEATWDSIPWHVYGQALLMDSQTKVQTKSQSSELTASRLLIVGPEGGFSPKELANFHDRQLVRVVNLPTPILRTTTAVATGMGIMIESLLK